MSRKSPPPLTEQIEEFQLAIEGGKYALDRRSKSQVIKTNYS
mgnify:CR=1 FL=1